MIAAGARCWPSAGEFAAEVEVLAVGLFQGGAQGLDFLAVLLLELVDLDGECENDGVRGLGPLVWRATGPCLGA
jgi:hypothetical protein